MRVKPTCSWCKEWEDFVEKPQVRSLVQCFKGLCKYLASSALAVELAQTNNGGKNSLLTLVQEGVAIPDTYSPPEPDLKLGFFPLLPTAPVTQPLKIEVGNPHQSPKCLQEKSSAQSTIRQEVEVSAHPSSGKVKQENKEHIDIHRHSPKKSVKVKDVESTKSYHVETKREKQPKKDSQHSYIKEHKHEKVKKSDKGQSRDNPNEQSPLDGLCVTPKSENEKPSKHATRAERSLLQTVAAEHDYNAAWSSPESPRTRNRKMSGYRSDDNSGPRSPPAKRQRLGSGTISLHIPTSLEGISPQPQLTPLVTRVLPPQSQAPSHINKEPLDHDPKLSWNVKPRKRVNKKPKPNGCRCGLATPNPGKLTCCGQRCPCYSAFKGCCPDCRCRGCRNPRKLIPDVPAPPPPPELFPPESTLTLRDVHSESEESEIEIDI